MTLLTHWEGEPVGVWAEVWGIPRLEAWATVGSTNDRVRELAAGGAAPFTTVIAEEQTAGRGRGGRRWSSPSGRGLWLSFLAPAGAGGGGGPVPLLVGLALARAVDEITGLEAGIKWPNDLWIQGRKVAGILCEGSGGTVVVGVGVNVRQRPGEFPPDLRDRASSLERETGRAVSRSRLAGALLRQARRVLDRPVLRLDGVLARELADRDVLRDRSVFVDGERGRAQGIDERGRLRIRIGPDRTRTVVAGEITLEVETGGAGETGV